MNGSRLGRFVVVAGMVAGRVLLAQGAHVMQVPGEVKWGPAPPMLPPGAEIAVIEGDPGKPAPYTVRLKFPAGYNIAAHSHPMDEHVAVIAGTFYIGMGDKMNKAGGKALGVGGFAFMPANMNHFAYTKSEVVVLLYGTGPVDFKYVNPADDPRAGKK
jgi:quercetin dioxygenase-like cupin family protein